MITNDAKFREAINFVSELTGTPIKDMLSPRRFKDAAVGRHFFRYYLRRNYSMPYQKIADYTKSNHATVINSIKYVENYSLFDKTYKEYKDRIDDRYLHNCLTRRDKVMKILKAKGGFEFRCNKILELIKTISNDKGAD